METVMTHNRFYWSQIDKYRAALNDEQMGKLLFAAADYAQTGQKEPMDDKALIFPYGELCYQIDKQKQRAGGYIAGGVMR